MCIMLKVAVFHLAALGIPEDIDHTCGQVNEAGNVSVLSVVSMRFRCFICIKITIKIFNGCYFLPDCLCEHLVKCVGMDKASNWGGARKK